MRIFITGGTGLVGRHVIAALRARGDTLRALARTETAAVELSELGAEPVRGDLSDAARLDQMTAGADAVVHAAAIVLAGGRWTAWHAANVLGTERVARSAARHGARNVRIFGSVVRGEDTPESDVDLLVEFEPGRGLLNHAALIEEAVVL